MPRSLRIVHPGVWYHITARGIERRPIFKDDRDRSHFLELLEELTIRFRLRLQAYVLMPNHYHLLIELSGPNLSRAIQWLNLSYSVWFNRRHRRAGYLFQGRFKSILVDPRAWAFSLSAYIHLNPVRITSLRLNKTDRQQARIHRVDLSAPLIQKRIQLLRAYRWSSYRAYAGLQTPPAWLTKDVVLQFAGAPKTGAPAKYRASQRGFGVKIKRRFWGQNITNNTSLQLQSMFSFRHAPLSSHCSSWRLVPHHGARHRTSPHLQGRPRPLSFP